MALKRTATPSEEMDATNAIILHTDRVQIALTRSAVEGRTAAQIEASIALLDTQQSLPAIYVHINRDGSIALATGAEPETWPEDDVG